MIPNLAQQACSAAARQKSTELAQASDDPAEVRQQLAAARAAIAQMREALRIVELCVPPAQRAIVREALALAALHEAMAHRPSPPRSCLLTF